MAEVKAYALLTKDGRLLAEQDELLVFTGRSIAIFVRKRRGYDDRGSERFCRVVEVKILVPGIAVMGNDL